MTTATWCRTFPDDKFGTIRQWLAQYKQDPLKETY